MKVLLTEFSRMNRVHRRTFTSRIILCYNLRQFDVEMASEISENIENKG